MDRTVKLDCGDHYIWTTIKNDDPQWEKFEIWRARYSTHSNAHPWAAWQAATEVAERDIWQKQARIERLESAVLELRSVIAFAHDFASPVIRRMLDQALKNTEDLA